MRKLVPFIIAIAIVVSMFAIPSAADSSVSEFTDFSGTLIVLWDWLLPRRHKRRVRSIP